VAFLLEMVLLKSMVTIMHMQTPTGSIEFGLLRRQES